MKSILIALLGVACLPLAGCSPTTASSMTDIYSGMTKDEVYAELGKPDKIRKLDGMTEVLKYELCISECWRVPGFRENEIYFIEIENDKVTQWHERRDSEGRKPTQNILPQVDPSVMQPRQTHSQPAQLIKPYNPPVQTYQPPVQTQPAYTAPVPVKTECRESLDGRGMDCTTRQWY